jgi:hypothetical protein
MMSRSQFKAVAKVPNWIVPREWPGERCFIIAGGRSVADQVKLIPKLRGRIIAIKQSVQLRPDADVMLLAARDDWFVCRDYFRFYRGPRIICRSNYPNMPVGTLYLRRTGNGVYSRDPRSVGGFDAGASAINLAALFGATEIIVLGMDMVQGRWVKNHPTRPIIPDFHFAQHLEGLQRMAPELKRDGVKVINCSPISAVPFFERRSLKEFV